MKEAIRDRIASLRQILRREGVGAFIIPSNDPHASEYVASHWKSREWLSGFNGSAGTLVVTLDKAGLWTDSRYFIQAAEQLKDTGIDLYKEKLPETPTIYEFLLENLTESQNVGIDTKVIMRNKFEEITNEFEELSITELDPIQEIWTDRPPIPKSPVFIYEMKYAGRSCTDKIRDIRKAMKDYRADCILISALDEIAWILNLRGNDVKYNPVAVCFLLIKKRHTYLFIDPDKLTGDVKAYLTQHGVEWMDYSTMGPAYGDLTKNTYMLVDPSKTSVAMLMSRGSNCRIKLINSPVSPLKAIRNKREIAGLREAMRKDGVALVKFLKWLEEAVPAGEETELSIDEKLQDFRSQQDLYVGQSFATIAGYGEHGAIVHYSATEESNATLLPKGFLLLDSGAQYLDGTTDITRTIALGDLTEEEKTDFTLVLKGHIALAAARFPAGTRGAQLDILARLPMWKRGMNYLHGTGHGVGHFLNVHEGPQSIRMEENPVTLQPGMVTSNEPGIYKAGSHGIRIENLILVVKDKEGMYGDYYGFETVTLCPISKKGIIKEMLTGEEIEWLNTYHQRVYKSLSPSLNEEEKAWLLNATASI